MASYETSGIVNSSRRLGSTAANLRAPGARLTRCARGARLSWQHEMASYELHCIVSNSRRLCSKAANTRCARGARLSWHNEMASPEILRIVNILSILVGVFSIQPLTRTCARLARACHGIMKWRHMECTILIYIPASFQFSHTKTCARLARA